VVDGCFEDELCYSVLSNPREVGWGGIAKDYVMFDNTLAATVLPPSTDDGNVSNCD